MKIEHVAVWVDDLELMRDFYVRFFDGKANKLYRNPEKDFQSYFITFREGARLELMKRMNVTERYPVDMLGWRIWLSPSAASRTSTFSPTGSSKRGTHAKANRA